MRQERLGRQREKVPGIKTCKFVNYGKVTKGWKELKAEGSWEGRCERGKEGGKEEEGSRRNKLLQSPSPDLDCSNSIQHIQHR